MKKQTEDILIAFALHEKLYYPQVKEIFKGQTAEGKQIQLKEMKRVISRPIIDPVTKNGALQFDMKD